MTWPENRVRIVGYESQFTLEEILVSSQAIREYLRLLWENYQGTSQKVESEIHTLPSLCLAIAIHEDTYAADT